MDITLRTLIPEGFFIRDTAFPVHRGGGSPILDWYWNIRLVFW